MSLFISQKVQDSLIVCERDRETERLGGGGLEHMLAEDFYFDLFLM